MIGWLRRLVSPPPDPRDSEILFLRSLVCTLNDRLLLMASPMAYRAVARPTPVPTGEPTDTSARGATAQDQRARSSYPAGPPSHHPQILSRSHDLPSEDEVAAFIETLPTTEEVEARFRTTAAPPLATSSNRMTS